MENSNKDTFFAPHLYIRAGVRDLSFYTEAFGAVENFRFSNDDGTVHVAEFSIGALLFHVHEEKPGSGELAPESINGVTALVGLFVEDVHGVINKAVAAGASIVSQAQDYDYGYRQGEIKDPFGHVWL